MGGLAVSSGILQHVDTEVPIRRIIAGNYPQYNHCINVMMDNEPTIAFNFYYITERYQLMGLRDIKIYLYGSYYKLPQWAELEEEVKIINGTFIHI